MNSPSIEGSPICAPRRVMDARRQVGWNLRRIRVAKGMSQKRFALEAGIDRAYVGRVERGSENVTLDRIETIAKTRGVAVSELFREVEDGASLPKLLPAGPKTRESERR